MSHCVPRILVHLFAGGEGLGSGESPWLSELDALGGLPRTAQREEEGEEELRDAGSGRAEDSAAIRHTILTARGRHGWWSCDATQRKKHTHTHTRIYI